jgi:hypothetical protein
MSKYVLNVTKGDAIRHCMGKVFELNRKRVFSIIEARQLLPIIRRVTDEANLRIRSLVSKLEAVKDHDPEKSKIYEDQINVHVSEWQTKIAKLGVEGKGLWLVDFDCGTGYYCWKYPEEKLEHFHGYTEGFQARVKMRDSRVPAEALKKALKKQELQGSEQAHASPELPSPSRS